MNTLDVYKQSIGRRVYLNREEECRLVLAAQSGDREAAGELVRAHAYQVIGLAGRYLGHGVELEDLIQAGNIGLLNAIRYFKPRKSRLSTYCHLAITHRIMREVEVNGGTIRRPDAWFRPKRIARLVAVLTREQSAALANRFHDANRMRGAIPDRDHSFDEEQHERARRLDDIRASVNDLDNPRHRLVIRARLNGETHEAIGKRMGVTKERVRQLEAKAVLKLREMLVLEPLAPVS